METYDRCECGGKIVSGYMYGERFISGDVDLGLAFYGNEELLKGFFPDGPPVRGKAARMCARCFKVEADIKLNQKSLLSN